VFENSTIFSQGQVTSLFASIYFLVVTISTVGYGDITPKSTLGRLTIILLILTGIALLPGQIDKLVKAIKQSKDPAHRRSETKGHVLLISHSGNGPNLINWLKEFYHAERKLTDARVCLLTNDDFNEDTSSALREKKLHFNIETLKGYAMKENDLERTNLAEAQASFVVSNQTYADSEEEDSKTILDTFAVKRYNPDIPLYVQIINLRHKAAAVAAGAHVVVCINEFRMGTLAMSCLCPGFSTLVCNLIKSVEGSAEIMREEKNCPVPSETNKDEIHDYVYGSGFELYVVEDMSNFANTNFPVTVEAIYAKCGALLIGIISDQNEQSLNPGKGYIIKKGDKGLVLAQDESVLPEVTSLHIFKQEEVNECRTSPTTSSTLSLDTEPTQFKPLDRLNFHTPTLPCRNQRLFAFKMKKEFTTDDPNHGWESQIPHQFDQENNFKEITSTKDEQIKDHLLVIGQWEDLYFFSMRVRKYQVRTKRNIVLLSGTLPDKTITRMMKKIDNSFFIQGSPTDIADLKRAGVEEAAKVVVLTLGNSKDPTSDSRSIMVYRLVKHITESPIVEIVYDFNMKYLGSLDQFGSELENPYLASGQVWSVESLDSLLVQSYYNPYVVKCVEGLLKGVVSSFPLSCLNSDLEGKTYAELFTLLLENDLVPLGLYRKSRRHRLSYVSTNPVPDCVLRKDDSVYVLHTQESLSERPGEPMEHQHNQEG